MTLQPPTHDELTARVAALEQAQTEVLAREQATREVLEIISRSPGNLDALLQAVAAAGGGARARLEVRGFVSTLTGRAAGSDDV